MSLPATESEFRAYFVKAGLLAKADAWLRDNPPPREWRAGPYGYAYTEMPLGMGW